MYYSYTFHSVNEIISLSYDVLGIKITKHVLYKYLDTNMLINNKYIIKHSQKIA
jgi:negative regulator of genetic competence, sporulation and motility